MRILLTVHQFLPQHAAGTEILTYSVARELMKRGHDVHVLSGYPGCVSMPEEDRFDEYDFDGIHVYRFHHAYIAMGGQVSMIEIDYDNRLVAAYFDRIIKKFNPDVVHYFHLNRLGSRLIECAVQSGIPRYMTPTDFWGICPMGQLMLGDGRLCAGPSDYAGNCLKHFAQVSNEGLVGKIVDWLPSAGVDFLLRMTKQGALPAYPRRVEALAIVNRLSINISRLNQLNALVVPTRFMRQLLVRHGVMPGLIIDAPFGINVTSHVIGERQSSYQSPLRVGFIGTIAHHKGCHVLIDAFKTLPAAVATLKIYGSTKDYPDYYNSLKLKAGNLQSIEFCGTFENSRIAQVLADIDVLVVPSLWYENTPLVLYSAQAARCPVVASNLPGLAEVIEHEVNGLLFDPGNSLDLARQLFSLINEKGLLQRLSAEARTPKSIEMYVEELLNIWRTVK